MEVHELEQSDVAQEESEHKLEQPGITQDTYRPQVQPLKVFEEVMDWNCALPKGMDGV